MTTKADICTKNRTEALIFATEKARREGTRGGWLWERELTTQRLPGPPLWVLSWRDKKVPPPAGTGSIVVLSGCIQKENPRLLVYNWLSAGLLAGFLRRVSFLFRQERHERTDIGEALCVLLPQSKPPSPMNPTRPHRKEMLIRFQIFKQALRIDCHASVRTGSQ